MESLSQKNRRGLAVMVQVLALAAVLWLAVWPRLERYFLLQAAEQNAVTLRLASDSLRAAVDRFAPLPHLIAQSPTLLALLREPDSAARVAAANSELLNTALGVSASDVYVMDTGGAALAASNYHKGAGSFVGQNFSFRPYFTEALAGGLGRYFALGTTSGERGYFYATPVRDGPEIVGVVALKFTVDGFEENWRGAASEIIVTDTNGIVAMSSRAQWHFKSTERLDDEVLRAIALNRQYPLEQITPLGMTRRALSDTADIVTLGAMDYVASTADVIESAGWSVTSLVPLAVARTQALLSVAVIGLVSLIVILAVAVGRQRVFQAVLVQRELEARVAERTEALRIEVEERRATEAELRRTQASLVQAGKLSALGQMSAALSHEFNQPLSAVKSYAENAASFLDRGQAEPARENIMRISALADRMARISKHLRNFARRPDEASGPVPLCKVIEDAVAVVEPRLTREAITLGMELPNGAPHVHGGHVRLQQVIVNLLSNAADASGVRGHVMLAVAPLEAGWQVTVRDHGAGIPQDAQSQMFDPFFTTKETGKGLGLGLSISFNIVRDFGGTLWGRNHPEGGAVFGVDLRAAEGTQEAAE
jgi:two-component system C4-dicarboxylate transport sensor histidine kinase DctB